MRRSDWLAHQLPVGMTDDDFLMRFLGIFQSVADTVLHRVDTLHHTFDPTVAPDGMVRLMGSWLGVEWIDSTLEDELQRRIVLEYADLLRWRGTAYGLRRLLEVISGGPAVVDDSGGVYPEGESPQRPAHVRLAVESSGWASPNDLLTIVRAELPASVTFELRIADTTVWPPTEAGTERQPSEEFA
jgi:phage tail-like protein